MKKGIWPSLFISLVGVAFLAAAAALLRPIHQSRQKYHLQTDNPLQDPNLAADLRLPPVILFTFRALAIDYLWIRADNLKEQGQYFDAQYLADMICKLQPNLDAVWDFQAWNMAYNISVALPTPQQRWHWVRRGFELLRDEGLRHNPRSTKIHRSLAWIFQHKMGGISDDHHRYYKIQLALEMTPLLSPWNSDEVNVTADLAAMVGMTSDWDGFRADPKIAELIKQLVQAEPSFSDREELLKGLVNFRSNPTAFAPPLHQVLADHRDDPALERLHRFARASFLRTHWKLDPARMVRINNRYGPIDYEKEDVHLSLDWRLPWCHAIYWAIRGLESTDQKTGFDILNLYRIVYHSLQNLYHYGNLQILAFPEKHPPQPSEPVKEVQSEVQSVQLNIFNSQDLRMFPIAYQATLDVLKTYEEAEDQQPTGTKDASANLCSNGIVNYYLAGHTTLARKYYRDLRQRYPDNKDYHVSLDEFVRNDMKKEIESISPKEAVNYIIAMLRNSYYRYAVGDEENATIRQNWARQVYQALLKEHPDEDDPTFRMKVRDFRELHWVALRDLLNDRFTNPNIKGLLLNRIKTMDADLYNRVMKEMEKVQKTSPS